ncbi:MAG: hypothetical protein RLZZ241_999 [Bacteroidota bacterium]|jgi:hypothetical protein
MNFHQLKFSVSAGTFLGLLVLTFLVFKLEMPGNNNKTLQAQTGFSTDRAFQHVKAISETPHGVGYPGHKRVQNYIIQQLEDLGLEVTLQSGYTAGDWGNLCQATNILARIPGRTGKKALALLSHYDSSPHSSKGASDAGSGVAVILEGLRAFLAKKIVPENDIIVLITDAEELGLNGAELFVSEHPWAKYIGLVLNFEARGSGGPGYMLIESNGGNSKLIEAFSKANPKYPVANSLAYSIYKMLPNDTDLTVFRSAGNIPGFNFAFIDDHFDYHTALDAYDRLDRNTLTHQGSYLMPLLSYFSQTDLSQLNSTAESVYFNFPGIGLLQYPASWTWGLYGLALILFALALQYGLKRQKITVKGLFLGFLPALGLLFLNGILGYFVWPVLKIIYPAYADILHGFTYNGYWYIAAAVALAIGNGFFIYNFWKRISTIDALIAPLGIWILLCGVLGYYLPGAAFFIIPGYALIATLWIGLLFPKKATWIYVVLSLPALWIFSPFVKLFPVGLGLKFMISASLLTTFIFLLVLGVVHQFSRKKYFGWLCWLATILFLGVAHALSSFTPERPKPNSLVYLLDSDTNQALWASYDKTESDWNTPFLNNSSRPVTLVENHIPSSKYGSRFTKINAAPLIDIKPPLVQIIRDTTIKDQRFIDFRLTPQRNINRVDLFCNTHAVFSARVNDIPLSDTYLARRGEKLVTHYVSDNAPTEVALVLNNNEPLKITVYEAATDLINHTELHVPKRIDSQIPMPFVLNDAVVVIKKIHFE